MPVRAGGAEARHPSLGASTHGAPGESTASTLAQVSFAPFPADLKVAILESSPAFQRSYRQKLQAMGVKNIWVKGVEEIREFSQLVVEEGVDVVVLDPEDLVPNRPRPPRSPEGRHDESSYGNVDIVREMRSLGFGGVCVARTAAVEKDELQGSDNGFDAVLSKAGPPFELQVLDVWMACLAPFQAPQIDEVLLTFRPSCWWQDYRDAWGGRSTFCLSEARNSRECRTLNSQYWREMTQDHGSALYICRVIGLVFFGWVWLFAPETFQNYRGEWSALAVGLALSIVMLFYRWIPEKCLGIFCAFHLNYFCVIVFLSMFLRSGAVNPDSVDRFLSGFCAIVILVVFSPESAAMARWSTKMIFSLLSWTTLCVLNYGVVTFGIPAACVTKRELAAALASVFFGAWLARKTERLRRVQFLSQWQQYPERLEEQLKGSADEDFRRDVPIWFFGGFLDPMLEEAFSHSMRNSYNLRKTGEDLLTLTALTIAYLSYHSEKLRAPIVIVILLHFYVAWITITCRQVSDLPSLPLMWMLLTWCTQVACMCTIEANPSEIILMMTFARWAHGNLFCREPWYIMASCGFVTCFAHVAKVMVERLTGNLRPVWDAPDSQLWMGCCSMVFFFHCYWAVIAYTREILARSSFLDSLEGTSRVHVVEGAADGLPEELPADVGRTGRADADSDSGSNCTDDRNLDLARAPATWHLGVTGSTEGAREPTPKQRKKRLKKKQQAKRSLSKLSQAADALRRCLEDNTPSNVSDLESAVSHLHRIWAHPDVQAALPLDGVDDIETLLASGRAQIEVQEVGKKWLSQGRCAQGPSGAADQSSFLCVICLDAEREMALVPCGHAVLCRACSQQITLDSNQCPLCKLPIQSTIKLFF
ncbi:hypothetical protein CYMTET_12627 [Cymbomonas tetramitiformis]|uniref:RING-type domain-containing protein n=1 Tax=Cymbomonas tetramitiformis TaxID=36881 RepID=A0AAE0GK23_9CHLO|nr:hypothetical protein CYMTET_12627 [Cymbomonas tetramitiformis]